MECLSCHAEVSKGKRFCMQCGARMPSTCPCCCIFNLLNARFCGDCGGQLHGDESPAARVEHPASAAERRQLTVMFCDLAGSTALSARLDPEDMRKVIGSY